MYPNPSIGSSGLSFLKNLNISGILDGTQKTLGVINQAIPIIFQVKPLVSNLGTIFKISNIMNDNSENVSVNNKTDGDINIKNKNSPIFFV